jgi:hypothetical protein
MSNRYALTFPLIASTLFSHVRHHFADQQEMENAIQRLALGLKVPSLAFQVAEEARGAVVGPGVISRRQVPHVSGTGVWPITLLGVPCQHNIVPLSLGDWELTLDEGCRGVIIVQDMVPPANYD